jgi:hypothetical protein
LVGVLREQWLCILFVLLCFQKKYKEERWL